MRTILGDVTAKELGACNAHEHVVISGSFVEQHWADFLLNDPHAAAVDLDAFKQAGGGWIIDTMPTGPGRDAQLLATISQQNEVAIVCPTGLHLSLYYAEDDPLLSMGREALAKRFIEEIAIGLDDGNGVLTHRAGVIKVAGNRDRLSDHQRQAFAAAADAHCATGCPIITHTDQGTAGLEQITLLRDHGVNLEHVVLSHCDRLPDVAYHRELLQAGVTLEYDNHFRDLAKTGTCPSAELIATLAPEFPNQMVVGMDLARRSYWHGHGGTPGLAWLLTDLPKHLANAGVKPAQVQRLYHENPARVFSFAKNNTIGDAVHCCVTTPS
ncbi:MAG: hypothetical protein V3V20_01760 [Algisphaera sp.]